MIISRLHTHRPNPPAQPPGIPPSPDQEYRAAHSAFTAAKNSSVLPALQMTLDTSQALFSKDIANIRGLLLTYVIH